MIITAVIPKPRRPGRAEVHVDGAFAFELAKARVQAHDLRVGRAIEQAQIDAIVRSERQREALEAAVALLARRPRAEREIRRRLAQRRFAPHVVNDTIERLIALRLIDDGAFARAWAESRGRTSPRGRRLLERELRATGVDAAIAATAVADADDEDAAYRLALSRRRHLEALDRVTFTARLSSLLQRRGFDWETTRATVARCRAEWRPDGGDDVDWGME